MRVEHPRTHRDGTLLASQPTRNRRCSTARARRATRCLDRPRRQGCDAVAGEQERHCRPGPAAWRPAATPPCDTQRAAATASFASSNSNVRPNTPPTRPPAQQARGIEPVPEGVSKQPRNEPLGGHPGGRGGEAARSTSPYRRPTACRTRARPELRLQPAAQRAAAPTLRRQCRPACSCRWRCRTGERRQGVCDAIAGTEKRAAQPGSQCPAQGARARGHEGEQPAPAAAGIQPARIALARMPAHLLSRSRAHEKRDRQLPGWAVRRERAARCGGSAGRAAPVRRHHAVLGTSIGRPAASLNCRPGANIRMASMRWPSSVAWWCRT